MPFVLQNRRTVDVRESLLSRVKLSHSSHAPAPTVCAAGLVGEEPVKSAGNSFARVVQGISSRGALRISLRALAGAGLASTTEASTVAGPNADGVRAAGGDTKLRGPRYTWLDAGRGLDVLGSARRLMSCISLPCSCSGRARVRHHRQPHAVDAHYVFARDPPSHTHSLTHSLTCSLAHSLTHSLFRRS